MEDSVPSPPQQPARNTSGVAPSPRALTIRRRRSLPNIHELKELQAAPDRGSLQNFLAAAKAAADAEAAAPRPARSSARRRRRASNPASMAVAAKAVALGGTPAGSLRVALLGAGAETKEWQELLRGAMAHDRLFLECPEGGVKGIASMLERPEGRAPELYVMRADADLVRCISMVRSARGSASEAAVAVVASDPCSDIMLDALHFSCVIALVAPLSAKSLHTAVRAASRWRRRRREQRHGAEEPQVCGAIGSPSSTLSPGQMSRRLSKTASEALSLKVQLAQSITALAESKGRVKMLELELEEARALLVSLTRSACESSKRGPGNALIVHRSRSASGESASDMDTYCVSPSKTECITPASLGIGTPASEDEPNRCAPDDAEETDE